ncbi:hypothetical protein [Nonomuraea sp. WAC 01424]|uniref:hypothetical protein n=1 Tax=Nonomuraea sp. WAC 01424 TaxID=2203200 RepID=UPI000F784746|nr:hypothetical protein [Nonomuraea sp. WAC 01424]
MATGTTVAVTVSTVSVALIALAGAVIINSGSDDPAPSRPTLRWTTGACVTDRYALTPCNGGDFEVLAVAHDPPLPADCPDDTDDVLRIGLGRTACVRSFLAPHAGAPGGGGRLLRPGDCVALDGREHPCAGPGWYGRSIAITSSADDCPSTTLDTLESGAETVCLGSGGRVLARGACVARPAADVVARSAVTRAACDSPDAWARIVSFETTPAACPADAQRYLRAAPGTYRPVTCLHLLSK